MTLPPHPRPSPNRSSHGQHSRDRSMPPSLSTSAQTSKRKVMMPITTKAVITSGQDVPARTLDITVIPPFCRRSGVPGIGAHGSWIAPPGRSSLLLCPRGEGAWQRRQGGEQDTPHPSREVKHRRKAPPTPHP